MNNKGQDITNYLGGFSRSLQTCREFPQIFREDRDGFRIYRQQNALTESVLDLLLPDPDLTYIDTRILKPGSRSHLGVVQIGGRPYVLKRYNCRGRGYQILNVFRRSRAMRAWRVNWQFKILGLPVPDPLICLEERHLRILNRSYVLMEFVNNARTLREAWVKSEKEEKRRLIENLGVLLGRTHRLGMIHGDLKWDNIMVKAGPLEKSIQFVDFDGSKILRRPNMAAARSDLERFLRDLTKEGGTGEDREALLHIWKCQLIDNELGFENKI
jgi:tRNA A-37 threonylcarbamoyl transferase component Bud32